MNDQAFNKASSPQLIYMNDYTFNKASSPQRGMNDQAFNRASSPQLYEYAWTQQLNQQQRTTSTT